MRADANVSPLNPKYFFPLKVKDIFCLFVMGWELFRINFSLQYFEQAQLFKSYE